MEQTCRIPQRHGENKNRIPSPPTVTTTPELNGHCKWVHVLTRPRVAVTTITVWCVWHLKAAIKLHDILSTTPMSVSVTLTRLAGEAPLLCNLRLSLTRCLCRQQPLTLQLLLVLGICVPRPSTARVPGVGVLAPGGTVGWRCRLTVALSAAKMKYTPRMGSRMLNRNVSLAVVGRMVNRHRRREQAGVSIFSLGADVRFTDVHIGHRSFSTSSLSHL